MQTSPLDVTSKNHFSWHYQASPHSLWRRVKACPGADHVARLCDLQMEMNEYANMNELLLLALVGEGDGCMLMSFIDLSYHKAKNKQNIYPSAQSKYV